jgi:hypothetical protein
LFYVFLPLPYLKERTEYLAIYVLVFYALGLRNVPMSFLIVVFSIINPIQAGLASLSVGLTEILMTNLYVFYGIPISFSGTATTLTRLVTFWFQVFVGYGIILGGAPSERWHAYLWTGYADTLVDLHPDGFVETFAAGTNGVHQIGYGILDKGAGVFGDVVETYPLKAPFSYASIVQNEATSELLYIVDELPLEKEEKKHSTA